MLEQRISKINESMSNLFVPRESKHEHVIAVCLFTLPSNDLVQGWFGSYDGGGHVSLEPNRVESLLFEDITIEGVLSKMEAYIEVEYIHLHAHVADGEKIIEEIGYGD